MDADPSRRPKRRLGVILALSALVPPVVYAAISIVSAHYLTRASNRPYRFAPAFVAKDVRPWSVRTADGVTLRGWFYPSRRAEESRLIVLVHGMHGAWDDAAGVARDLHRRGFHLLAFDLRGHGRSEPTRLSMGRRERGDLRAVLDWAKREGFSPERIGWVGYSMGAATLLMEGAENREIRTVVLDSPFGDLPELLDRQLTEHSGLPKAFNPGIMLAAHHVFDVRTDDIVPSSVADRWADRPVLLIHGEADSTVPVKQARAIAMAAGPRCRAVFLPGVEHCEAYNRAPAGYVATLAGFFDKNLTR